MSALGQKQTYAPQQVMSALRPKADMCRATRDVRFGPMAQKESAPVWDAVASNFFVLIECDRSAWAN
jgi:hypothetical protein